MALNPLSVIRSPSPRGAGEKSAEIARPGPGARHDGNHWGLNRVNWAHGFYPESHGKQFSMKTLERQAMEEVAVSGGIEPDAAALMPLDELLVLPDIQAQLAGGISSHALMPIAAPSLADELTPGAIMTLPVLLSRSGFSLNETRYGRAVQAPLKLLSVSWAVSTSSGPDRGSIAVGVTGLGDLHVIDMVNAHEPSVRIDFGDGLLISSGTVQPYVRLSCFSTVENWVNASVQATVQRLERR